MSGQQTTSQESAAGRRPFALLQATLAVVTWGASFVATKVALQDVAPVTVVWLRFAIGVAILGLAVFARGQFARVPPRELALFALLGFLGITFHQWLQSNGLVTAQATTSAWIVATTPIFIALLGWLVLQERLVAWQVAGIMLAAAGVLLVVSQGDLTALAAGRFGAPGDLLVMVSAPNWAVFTVLSRGALRNHPPARMMFYVMSIGWIFTSLLFFTGPGLGDVARLRLPGWLGIGFLGVFCSGLAYIFWYDALHALPASQVGAFLYVEPIVTVIVAAAVLRESLTLAAVAGGGVILLGVWLVNRRPGRAPDA